MLVVAGLGPVLVEVEVLLHWLAKVMLSLVIEKAANLTGKLVSVFQNCLTYHHVPIGDQAEVGVANLYLALGEEVLESLRTLDDDAGGGTDCQRREFESEHMVDIMQ